MSPDHTFSEDHERRVLITLFSIPSFFDEFPELTEDHFHAPAHKIAFSAALRTRREFPSAQTLDRPRIYKEIRVSLTPDQQSWLASVWEDRPDEEHFPRHVESLRHYLARRRAVEQAEAILDAARHSSDIGELLDATGAKITAIQEEIAGCRKAPTTRQIIHAVVDEWEALAQGHKQPAGILTSLPVLNQYFKGLHPGHLVIIGGYPGGGKTVLGTQLCLDAAFAENAASIYTLEMSREQMALRCLPYTCGMDGDIFSDPAAWMRSKPSKYDLMRIRRGEVKLAEAPLEIHSAQGENAMQICARLRVEHRKRGLRIAMVDFIQRIRPTKEMVRESREQQISEAVNMIADTAKDLGMTIILPSQLSKEGATKHAESINEAGDLTLKILQDKEKKHTGIFVEKDRFFGHSGLTLPLVLKSNMLKFVEEDPREEPTHPRY